MKVVVAGKEHLGRGNGDDGKNEEDLIILRFVNYISNSNETYHNDYNFYI